MLSTGFFLFTSMLFACGKGIIKLDDSKVDRNQLGKLRNEIVSLVQEEGEIYNYYKITKTITKTLKRDNYYEINY